MRRVLFAGLFLLALYFIVSVDHMKVWFAVILGAIGIFAIFKTELQLRPALQFALASILILATLVATNWTSLEQRDLIQAAYTFWTLTVFRQGFKWAYSRIARGMSLIWKTV